MLVSKQEVGARDRLDRVLDRWGVRVRGDFALASLDEPDNFLEGIDADTASSYIGGLRVVFMYQ